MTQSRGPQHSAKCPFYIDKASPLSADASICLSVACVTCGDSRLQEMKADLRQTAYLTICDALPAYDPSHQKGASFITFMRSRVCGTLWNERKKPLKNLGVLFYAISLVMMIGLYEIVPLWPAVSSMGTMIFQKKSKERQR